MLIKSCFMLTLNFILKQLCNMYRISQLCIENTVTVKQATVKYCTLSKIYFVKTSLIVIIVSKAYIKQSADFSLKSTSTCT